MTQSRLDILLSAKNSASPQIKQVQSDLRGLDGAANTASKGLGGLAGSLGVAGIVALGAAAAGTINELAQVGAQAQRVGNAYDDLARRAGESGAAMLDAMRSASQGTISDTDLMLAANKAMMLGVADSAQEMSALLEIAGARGKAMGLSTTQAFNDIVTGLGRGSALILDNLGITVDLDRAYKDYAATLGITASALDDAQKKQALINQVLSESAGLVGDSGAAAQDAASANERLAASWANLRAAVGQNIAPDIAEAKNATADFVDWIAKLSAEEGKLQGEIDRTKARLDNINAATANNSILVGNASDATGALEVRLGQLNAALVLVQGGMQQSSGSTAALRGEFAALGAEAEATGPKLRQMGADALAAMDAFNVAMAASRETAGLIERAASGSGAFIAGKEGGEAGLARQKEVNDLLAAQVKLWEDQGHTAKEINDVLLPGYVSQMNEAERAAYRVNTQVAKIPEEVREAQQAFDELKGKVEGVLQSMLDPGVGVDPDKLLADLGLRPDAVNENARRLADIAQKGLADQDWLGDFAADVPDIFEQLSNAANPQAAAAQMLKEFQMGLRPELIDRAQATELVRAMLVGEERMSALAQEIATELSAEMGRTPGDILGKAKQALGVTDTNLAGADAGGTFTAGMAGGLDGAAIVDTVVTQMRAVYTRIQSAGSDAGKSWGASFLAIVGENVPPALVKILTDLATPGVLANIARLNSQTGAAQ